MDAELASDGTDMLHGWMHGRRIHEHNAGVSEGLLHEWNRHLDRDVQRFEDIRATAL